MKIFFDGGWLPIAAQMETAVVARGLLYHRPRLGAGSSELAEWLALLDALRVARLVGAEDVILLGDSASVINQVRSVCRSRTYLAHLQDFREQARAFSRVRLRHVQRSQNLAGIALARMRDGAGGILRRSTGMAPLVREKRSKAGANAMPFRV